MAERRGAKPQLQFRLPLDGEPPKDLKAVAYLFDRRGGLLGTASAEGGDISFDVDSEKAARARLLVGPEMPADRANKEPTIEALQRLGAYEPAWRFDAKQPVQQLVAIPERIWRPWFLCSCLVRGQVVRRVSVAGSLQDLPVCNARVHLCEVDPILIIIKRLPDDLILRIRDDLLQELHRPIPIPDPPPFVIDPGFIDPSPELAAVPALTKTRAGLVQRVAPLASAEVAASREPAMALKSLGSDVPAFLRLENASAIRAELIANIDLIRPWLCWPWLWPWYRCDELAVLETNADGRFETSVWYPCFGDQPDIYVWVEFFIDGVWTPVYRPPIACYTRWDYDCGDDILIRLTDPRVPVCGEPPESPGKSVTIMAIGENTSVHEIQMSLPISASEGLTTAGEPFGGTLEPRVLWGRTALFAAGITHYRWSYRRLTTSDGTTAFSDPDFHHMTRDVQRHYESPPTLPGHGPSYPTEKMGPAFGSEEVFRIQPFFPTEADAAGGDGWQVIDAHEDLATAFFETVKLNVLDPESVAGRYELKLELFKIVANVPQVVDLTAEGVSLFIPDIDAPFGAQDVTTSPPPNDQFYFRDSGTNHVVGFRLVVRVDNNVCHGNIIDVSAGGSGAGPCGFIEYHHGDNAVVSFMASHPHNFATFGFDVYRGAGCHVDPASAAGNVGDSSANGFSRLGTVFSKTIPVSTLLSSTTDPINCPACTQDAAFAETLAVYAMATDGWYRLYTLDAPRGGPTERANKAFALEQHGGP
jgi:hypothetical protein